MLGRVVLVTPAAAVAVSCTLLGLALLACWPAFCRLPFLDHAASPVRQVKYIGPGSDDRDAAAVRANHPIPADCPLYYFEVEITSRGRDGFIGGWAGSSEGVAVLKQGAHVLLGPICAWCLSQYASLRVLPQLAAHDDCCGCRLPPNPRKHAKASPQAM